MEEPDWASFPFRGYVGFGMHISFKIVVLDADLWIGLMPDRVRYMLCEAAACGDRIMLVSNEEEHVDRACEFLRASVNLFVAQPRGSA